MSRKPRWSEVGQILLPASLLSSAFRAGQVLLDTAAGRLHWVPAVLAAQDPRPGEVVVRMADSGIASSVIPGLDKLDTNSAFSRA